MAKLMAKKTKNPLNKYVYFIGAGKADGKAEMTNLAIPVPPGFTVMTEVCTLYCKNNRIYPPELKTQVETALAKVEKIKGKKFGDPVNPLLVSVRSGARSSMPGMMETVRNVGLTSKTIPGLIRKTNNERFMYDAYRRLLMMYSDVVMKKAAGIEPEDGGGIRQRLEHAMEAVKKQKGYASDTDLTVGDLKILCDEFRVIIKHALKKEFSDNPMEQFWGGISAVFQSWMGKRAVSYRRIEKIPEDWGTTVNVPSMVFGNTGDNSATGVAFTRNPATGENMFFGEWLPNAQGEDVLAGIRTPNPVNEAGKAEDTAHLHSLEKAMPKLYRELFAIQKKLEKHCSDMQDIEFTIEDGRLWMLQIRVGKRNGQAAIRMTVEMAKSKLVNRETALMRVKPQQIDELLHPSVAPVAEKKAVELAKGLSAGPRGAIGRIVLTADGAKAWATKGKRVILVRNETSPEDVHGILTAKGGMTSHAALVARGSGKCCIVGCSVLDIDVQKKDVHVNGRTLGEGDWITLNGTKGRVYEGKLDLLPAGRNPWYKELMKWADQFRTLSVRTNADAPNGATVARSFGAEGIGLCRTERMFFGLDRIKVSREMILKNSPEVRKKVLAKPDHRDNIINAIEKSPIPVSRTVPIKNASDLSHQKFKMMSEIMIPHVGHINEFGELLLTITTLARNVYADMLKDVYQQC